MLWELDVHLGLLFPFWTLFLTGLFFSEALGVLLVESCASLVEKQCGQSVIEKGIGVFTNQSSDLSKLSSSSQWHPGRDPAICRAKPVTLSGQEIRHIVLLYSGP